MTDIGTARLDLRALRRAFDRAAPEYDQHAVLQREVGQRLLERLEYVRLEPARVLDVGCGTGTATYAMKQAYPGANVIGVDWSLAMLQQLQARESDQVSCLPLCVDMQALPLAARSMDIVFSNLAVYWSADPVALFAEFRRVLRPGGIMLFSTFGPDTLYELRTAWSRADDKAHVNQFMDMHDIGDLVVAAGFAEPVFDVDLMTLEYKDVVSLMRDLKAIGVHNALIGRSKGLTGKDKFSRVLQAYEVFCREEIYPATYEVIYGVAFGPKDGQPVRSQEGEIATFPVDAIRTARKRETK